MMKKCSKCKEVKPYSEFSKDKKGKDGLRSNCKDCKKQYCEENKEKISQQKKQQVQSPEFNIVGDSGTNQIAEVLGQQAKKPQKAFVVSKEVSSQQELDRNIETSASLG